MAPICIFKYLIFFLTVYLIAEKGRFYKSAIAERLHCVLSHDNYGLQGQPQQASGFCIFKLFFC